MKKSLHEQNKAFTGSILHLSNRGCCFEFSTSLYACSVHGAIFLCGIVHMVVSMLSEGGWHLFIPTPPFWDHASSASSMPQVPLFYNCAHFVFVVKVFFAVYGAGGA